MQTDLLYLKDSYQKNCSATTIDINPHRIVLDQTIFYPEGGGQPSDQGLIKSKNGSFKVHHVLIKGDQVIHEGKLTGEMKIGEQVKCEIDWDRRYHNMQVHSAGHLVHEAVKQLIPDAVPLEGQHGKHAYIKYLGVLNKLLEQRIKLKVNELIAQELPIHTEFVSLEELQKRASWIPPRLPTNKPLRIMWIGDFEPIPDGGTQVKSTSEIPTIDTITVESQDGQSLVVYQLQSTDKQPRVSAGASGATSISKDQLINLKNEAIAMALGASGKEELEQIRIQYLGKSGQLAQIAKQLGSLPADEKKELGQLFNDVKSAIQSTINSKLEIRNSKLEIDKDLTLPGTPTPAGVLHPITAVTRELNDIFQSLGFSVADGPELENDEYNYNRLNLPPDHPARDLQDTLYIKEPDIILRTHTSSVEAHILAETQPPYRFVIPGKVYRYENLSVANNAMFFQYQGLAVGEGITMANLKATINTFIRIFYGPERKSRFRCKYYPEVEPGVGVDIDCPFCSQKGCAVCKQRGWIEMLGAGMIHPNMLRLVDLNPDKISGFAWGMGLDRIVMTRYGINDIRSLTNGDLIYLI